MARVHLVDASPFLFRAWFALPDTIRDPRGRPVNAVYGFLASLLRLVEEEKPTHLGVAFDLSLTTSFRNDFYPAYKAQRPPPPPELEAQQEACREVTAALGAAVFADERYEADDLIATVVHRLRRRRHRAVIVSGDKDLCQLVGKDVELYDFAKDVRYGPREVEERFGVPPERIPDLQGLMGDAVDNIPGVPGVGPRTAVALLGAFGTLEGVYERLDEVAGLPLRGARTLGARLAAHRELAFVSRRLARAATDASLRAGLRELRLRRADPARLDPLLARLGLEGFRDRIAEGRP